jgi:hypothetical protein
MTRMFPRILVIVIDVAFYVAIGFVLVHFVLKFW